MNASKLARIFAFSSLLWALLSVPEAFGVDDPAEQKLHQLLEAFLAGASVNDAELHDRFWAEDLVYTSSTGERRGKAEIMAALCSAPEADPGRLPEYTAQDVNIRVFDSLAVITFRLVAGMPDGKLDEYFNTGAFRLDDGNWRAFAWQATRIPLTESAD